MGKTTEEKKLQKTGEISKIMVDNRAKLCYYIRAVSDTAKPKMREWWNWQTR